jgi:hypothetical protein
MCAILSDSACHKLSPAISGVSTFNRSRIGFTVNRSKTAISAIPIDVTQPVYFAY